MKRNEDVYPGVPSVADFTPKNVEAIQFTDELNDPVDRLIGPAANISESPTEYLIEVAVPGLKREHFNIEMKQGVIRISAKMQEEGTCSITDRVEFNYQDWTRAFILPKDADNILTQANYRDGALCIHIPRGEMADNKTPVFVTVY